MEERRPSVGAEIRLGEEGIHEGRPPGTGVRVRSGFEGDLPHPGGLSWGTEAQARYGSYLGGAAAQCRVKSMSTLGERHNHRRLFLCRRINLKK